MSLFLSLILGIGVCLVYLSCFPEGQKPVRSTADSALVVALRKAGMHTLTPRTFTWVSVASAVVLSLLLLMMSQLVALGVLGFIAGFVAPRVVVNHRARAVATFAFCDLERLIIERWFGARSPAPGRVFSESECFPS